MDWTTVILAPNPSWEGAFKDRSEQKRTVDRRGRQLGPRMPLVSSLLKTFPWVLQDPHQETRLGRKGASQYWQELGGAGWKGRTASGSPPVTGGWSCFLAQSARSPWRWEEEELGM